MTAPSNTFVLLASCTLILACGTALDDRITSPAAPPAQFAAAPHFSAWSEPVSLGPTINTPFSDAQPALSRNGLSLYFTSQRPEFPGDAVLDNNIWVARRACLRCQWESPVILGPAINSARNDASPALSRDEHYLFFTTNRTGSQGNDIWVAYRKDVRNDFVWQPPVNLGPGVNTPANETGASYFEKREDDDDDEKGIAQLFFNRQFGPANIPAGDIYVSEQSLEGAWGSATPVSELNSPAADQKPSIDRKGLQIYFWSARDAGRGVLGDAYIWRATRPHLGNPWSQPELVSGPINDQSSTQPFIYTHGRTETLLFVRNAGTRDQVNLDLVMSTRTRGQNGDDHEDGDDVDDD